MSGVAITKRGRHVKPVVSYKDESSSLSSPSSSSSEEEEEEEEAIDPEYDPTFPTPELNAEWEALRHTNALAALIALLKDSPLDSPFSTEYARLLRAWQEAGYDARAPVLTRPSRTVRAQWPARRRAFWARVASWLVVREQRGEVTYEDRAGKPQEEPPSAMDVYPDEGTPELPYPANLPEVVDDEEDESDSPTLTDLRAIWEDDIPAEDKQGLDAAFEWLVGYQLAGKNANRDPDEFKPKLLDHYYAITSYRELHRIDRGGGPYGVSAEDLDMLRKMIRVVELLYHEGPVRHDTHFARLIAELWRPDDQPATKKRGGPKKPIADVRATTDKLWNEYYERWLGADPAKRANRNDTVRIKNDIENLRRQIIKPKNEFDTNAMLKGKTNSYEFLITLLKRIRDAKGYANWVFPDDDPFAPLPMEPAPPAPAPAPAQPKEVIVVDDDDEQDEAEPMETSPMPKTQAAPGTAPGTPLAPLVAADEAQLRNLEERQVQAKALLEEVRNYLEKVHVLAIKMAETGLGFGKKALADSRKELGTYRDRWRALTQGTILDFEHEWEQPAAIELRTMEEQIERLKRKIEQEKAHLDATTAALEGKSLLAVAREWRNIKKYVPVDEPRALYWRNIITEFRERRAAMRNLLAEEEAIRARVAANKAELIAFLDKVRTSQGQADQVERDLEIAGVSPAPEPSVSAVEKKRVRLPESSPEEEQQVEPAPMVEVTQETFANAVLEAIGKVRNSNVEHYMRSFRPGEKDRIVKELVPQLRSALGWLVANKDMLTDDRLDYILAVVVGETESNYPELIKAFDKTITRGPRGKNREEDQERLKEARIVREKFWEELPKTWNLKIKKGGAKGGKSAPKIRVQQELK